MHRRMIMLWAIVIALLLAGCTPALPEPPSVGKEAEYIAPAKEDFELCYQQAIKVRPGKVEISRTTEALLDEYPDDTVFLLSVFLPAALTEEELPGYSTTEFLQYYEIAEKYCRDAGMYCFYGPNKCYQYRFFYAKATKANIEALTCGKDMALYIAITGGMLL